ncbi:MAG: POTRA domain-containing protein [Acidobacteriota bacterium]
MFRFKTLMKFQGSDHWLCKLAGAFALCLTIARTGLTQGESGSGKTLSLQFDGNKAVSEGELITVTQGCMARNNQQPDKYNSETLGYCLSMTRQMLFSKGYLQATMAEPKTVESNNAIRVTVSIKEGALFRLGNVVIQGANLVSPKRIREMLNLKTGDIANADTLMAWSFDELRKTYAEFGYIQFMSSLEPSYQTRSDGREGIINLVLTIHEGQAFTVRSIKFEGNGTTTQDSLLQQMLVRSGDIFNKELFEASLKRIDQSGQFETINSDRDVDYRSDKNNLQLDLLIHLKKKMERQDQ